MELGGEQRGGVRKFEKKERDKEREDSLLSVKWYLKDQSQRTKVTTGMGKEATEQQSSVVIRSKSDETRGGVHVLDMSKEGTNLQFQKNYQIHDVQ